MKTSPSSKSTSKDVDMESELPTYTRISLAVDLNLTSTMKLDQHWNHCFSRLQVPVEPSFGLTAELPVEINCNE